MFQAKHDTAVGVFADRNQADRAVDQLVQAGFRQEQIELVARDGGGAGHATHVVPATLRAEGGAALCGLIGAIIGGLLGTMVGTGWITGIGPLFSGGALAGIVGAAIGVVVGAVLGGLIGWGFMADDEGFYVREVHAGRTLLLIHDDGRCAQAAAILRQNQANRVRTASASASQRAAGDLGHSALG